MKQTKKLTAIKLTVTKQSLKVLSSEHLATVAGGRPNDSFSCVNLCISINACR